MQFEVIEYAKDESGKKKVSTTYNIDQFDLSRAIDDLNEAVRNGTICDYEIASV